MRSCFLVSVANGVFPVLCNKQIIDHFISVLRLKMPFLIGLFGLKRPKKATWINRQDLSMLLIIN